MFNTPGYTSIVEADLMTPNEAVILAPTSLEQNFEKKLLHYGTYQYNACFRV